MTGTPKRESAHTPTPWWLTQHQPESEWFGSIMGISDPTETGDKYVRPLARVTKYGTAEENIADAHFIVRAVNCYYDLLSALKLCIPVNACLTNPNIRDDMIVPLDVPMGDLRKIAAAIAKAESSK